MDLTRLVAKQKRYKDWLCFTESEVKDQNLSALIHKHLGEYKELLMSCWAKKSCSDLELSKLQSLERLLSQLNNDARLDAGY